MSGIGWTRPNTVPLRTNKWLEESKFNSFHLTVFTMCLLLMTMDGYDLFLELKKLDPGLPIIISSGFGDVDVTSRIALEETAGMISKPYTAGQLREVLQKVVKAA